MDIVAAGRRAPCDLFGFTLVELVTVIAVLAIILSMVAPGLSDMLAEHRLQGQADQLYLALSLARSEALKRNSRVTVCKGNRSKGCVMGGEWSQGWLSFVDTDGDGEWGEGETLLAFEEPVVGMSIRGNRPVANYVSFNALGYPQLTSGAFQAGTLLVCSGRSGQIRPRGVILSRLGAIRTEPKPESACGQ